MEKHHKYILKKNPDPITFLGWYVVGGLVAVGAYYFFQPLIALGILILVLGEVLRKAETFYLLEGGVMREYRFLTTSRKFVEYEKIQNIEVGQSLIENIFGVGHVKFDTSGSDKMEIHFYGVRKPYKIEKIVREKMIMH